MLLEIIRGRNNVRSSEIGDQSQIFPISSIARSFCEQKFKNYLVLF